MTDRKIYIPYELYKLTPFSRKNRQETTAVSIIEKVFFFHPRNFGTTNSSGNVARPTLINFYVMSRDLYRWREKNESVSCLDVK